MNSHIQPIESLAPVIPCESGHHNWKPLLVRRRLMTLSDMVENRIKFFARYHPILRRNRPHHGIDYAAAYGTPVVSIGSGVVTFRGWKGANGKMIEVRHNGTYRSLYGHLSRYARGVAPGRKVKQGQVIGFVGSTGRSTGPHLHFGFKRSGDH